MAGLLPGYRYKNNTMTLKEKGMIDIIDSQEKLIKELTREIRNLSRKNLKLRVHMQVLVNHPKINASKRIRQEQGNKHETIPELILALQN
jgi:hypothetical protein